MTELIGVPGQTGRPLALAALALVALAGSAESAAAAESGTSFYLLGQKGPYAAILPPPGIFFQNDTYFYKADLGGSKNLPLGGKVTAGVRGKAVLDAPTLLWSTPWQVLGGRLAFSATAPFGDLSVHAKATGPFGNTVGVSDDTFTIGDPLFGSVLSWDAGDFHWSANTLLNVPIGDYKKDALANVAIHRWGIDVSGAGTYLNPQTGFEVSGVLGVTFNGENHYTNYNTGNEFHAEWSVTQAFSKAFSAGFVGYYYKQISDDTGSGAKLGGFRGQVLGLGGTAALNFNVGIIPVSARIKVYREMDVKNRLKGTAGWFTLAMPLYVAQKPSQPLTTKY